MSGVIIFFNELTLDLSYHGFNSFINIFKLPIGVLATAIPIIAVFATNHRSEQTKRQIEVANSQNNFINYYRHREEFDKYLEQHVINGTIHKINSHKLHKTLFPLSDEGHFELSESILEKTNKSLSNIEHIYKSITYKTCARIEDLYEKLYESELEIIGLFKIFHISSSINGIAQNFNGKVITFESQFFYSYFKTVNKRVLAIESIFSFDKKYIKSKTAFFINISWSKSTWNNIQLDDKEGISKVLSGYKNLYEAIK